MSEGEIATLGIFTGAARRRRFPNDGKKRDSIPDTDTKAIQKNAKAICQIISEMQVSDSEMKESLKRDLRET